MIHRNPCQEAIRQRGEGWFDSITAGKQPKGTNTITYGRIYFTGAPCANKSPLPDGLIRGG